jgi:hypothetical protein
MIIEAAMSFSSLQLYLGAECACMTQNTWACKLCRTTRVLGQVNDHLHQYVTYAAQNVHHASSYGLGERTLIVPHWSWIYLFRLRHNI